MDVVSLHLSIGQESHKIVGRERKLNKEKIAGIIVSILIVFALVASFAVQSTMAPSKQATSEIQFTVSGKNDCLRFLNETVGLVYVPFTVDTNKQGQLTINCTKMPGGANGYTDIYIYKGYWDEGINHTCLSSNVYSILSQIHSADYELKGTTSYNQTFGGSTQESYTVFFVFPPGGQATFQVAYKPT
jgi:hypothetical protein